MSVQINFTSAPEGNKWSALKDGDFVILEATHEVPLETGLYRVFPVPEDNAQEKVFCLFPLFAGPFPTGLYPIFVNSSQGFPKMTHLVSNVTITAEIQG